jgi:hypothetical protein
MWNLIIIFLSLISITLINATPYHMVMKRPCKENGHVTGRNSTIEPHSSNTFSVEGKFIIDGTCYYDLPDETIDVFWYFNLKFQQSYFGITYSPFYETTVIHRGLSSASYLVSRPTNKA